METALIFILAKKLLSDTNIKKYYERKMAEGKAYGVVANAIKFKLLLRMFAVIKRQTPFVRKPDFIFN